MPFLRYSIKAETSILLKLNHKQQQKKEWYEIFIDNNQQKIVFYFHNKLNYYCHYFRNGYIFIFRIIESIQL